MMGESATNEGPEKGEAAAREQARGGVVSVVRRRVLPWTGRLWAGLGVLVLAGWLTGRVLTDEQLWSQYLFWVPTVWVIGVAAGCWVMSWVSGLLATRMSGDLVRPMLAVGVIGVAGWMLGVEWRGYRIVRLPVDAGEASVKVAFWNCSSKADLEGAEVELEELGADLTVVMNPTREPEPLRGLMEALGRAVQVPEQESGAAAGGPGLIPELPDPGVRLMRRYGLVVASRMPILKVGDAWLEQSDGGDDRWRTAGYGGRAVFLELDASEVLPDLDRPLVVWVIDLPSDPSLHKFEPARRAKAAIEGFAGPVLEPNGLGLLVRSASAVEGFPTPDVVVGDFNAPRGSASLRVVVGEMDSAHDQAGFGPDTTWDQPWAWWAIDQMFVGEGFGARRFDARLLHHHAHSVVVGDVVIRD